MTMIFMVILVCLPGSSLPEGSDGRAYTPRGFNEKEIATGGCRGKLSETAPLGGCWLHPAIG